MNQDNNQTGQQGYGRDQETDQQNKRAEGQQQNAQPIGGNDSNTGSGTTLTSGSSTGEFSTGQAAYGNSGQADAASQSQNSADLGQEADLGQAGSSNTADGGAPLGAAGGGYGGSGETQSGGQSGSGFVGSSTDNSGDYVQSGSSDQDFADQGQGAMNEDLMGSPQSADDNDDDDYAGTTDIETERSQGRESDIEGSSL